MCDSARLIELASFPMAWSKLGIFLEKARTSTELVMAALRPKEHLPTQLVPLALKNAGDRPETGKTWWPAAPWTSADLAIARAAALLLGQPSV